MVNSREHLGCIFFAFRTNRRMQLWNATYCWIPYPRPAGPDRDDQSPELALNGSLG